MNTHDELTRQLGDRLREEVSGAGSSTITLDDVRGTATRIRRRRAAVAGAGVAAVIALVVPTAIGTGVLQSAPEPPPVNPAPTVTEAPRPSGPVVLGPDAPSGKDPRIAYLDGRKLVDGDRVIKLDADYDSLAAAGDDYVVTRQAQPGVFVDVVDSSGTVVETSETTQRVVSSADRTVAAWVTPGGEVLVRFDGRTEVLGTVDSTADAVAVLGSESCDPEVGAQGCVVYVNHQAENARPETVGTNGGQSLAGRFGAVRTVSPDGAVAGFAAEQDADVMTPPCSVVVGSSGGVQLETCRTAFEYAGAGFSPDGTKIVGTPSDIDGIGSRSLTVLDAQGGGSLLEVEVEGARENSAGSIVDTAWEDPTHVLVKVALPADGPVPYDLYRVGLDGSVEQLLENDRISDSMVQPWVFVD